LVYNTIATWDCQTIKMGRSVRKPTIVTYTWNDVIAVWRHKFNTCKISTLYMFVYRLISCCCFLCWWIEKNPSIVNNKKVRMICSVFMYFIFTIRVQFWINGPKIRVRCLHETARFLNILNNIEKKDQIIFLVNRNLENLVYYCKIHTYNTLFMYCSIYPRVNVLFF